MVATGEAEAMRQRILQVLAGRGAAARNSAPEAPSREAPPKLRPLKLLPRSSVPEAPPSLFFSSASLYVSVSGFRQPFYSDFRLSGPGGSR